MKYDYIVVGSGLGTAAGGVDRDLIFSFCNLTAAALLVHRA